MKIAQFKNGSMAYFEKTGNCYVTYARNAAGDILDKMRCDDYRSACEYYRAFQKLAKNS